MSLAIWKTRISYEYKKLRDTRNSQIRDAWCENWNKCDQGQNDENSVSWHLKPIVYSKTRRPTIHLLKEIPRLPPMSNWVLTPRNSFIKNEKMLLNIPFIGDLKEGHGEFLQDLLQSYGRNVLGAVKSHTSSDEFFLDLMQTLILNYVPASERNLPLNPIIFEAMSSYYFKEATPQQLKEKYEQLTKPNCGIGIGQPPNSCEHALQTFKKYFCRRCYRYNCDLHPSGQEEFATGPTQVKRNPFFRNKIPDGECGANCYRKLTSAMGSESIKSKAGFQSFSDSTDKLATLKFHTLSSNIEPAREWSDDEKTLFRVLYRIFPNKYCIIAETMLSKTCQQVYEYFQDEIENIPAVISGPSQMSIVPKIRKRNGWALYKRKQHANDEDSSRPTLSYTPCNHSVKSCDRNDCCCVSNRLACEKYCNCSQQCKNKFYGCTCHGPCTSGKCPCFVAQRECDPDLCSKCGANKYNLSKIKCRNISIQRGLRKHLLLAPSDIAGWGVFLKDGAHKDEFISEYVGEIISQEEADRRGKVYDMRKCSYLFELNGQFVVDATYQGGKIRFANHSINPNCYAKVMMVLGDHRIGIFAKRDISPGEEIFFDYRYAKEQLKFVGIEREVESS